MNARPNRQATLAPLLENTENYLVIGGMTKGQSYRHGGGADKGISISCRNVSEPGKVNVFVVL
jgi:hypothetical protein